MHPFGRICLAVWICVVLAQADNLNDFKDSLSQLKYGAEVAQAPFVEPEFVEEHTHSLQAQKLHHLVKTSRAKAAWSFKDAASAIMKGKAKGGKYTCLGLVPKMCNACFLPGMGGKECGYGNKECAASFCTLCKRLTWECKVKFGGKMKDEAKDPSYGQSLCSQDIAFACSKMFKCCPDDEALFNYIQNWAFFDSYPNPKFPSPSCVQGPNAKLCSMCKGAVQVKVKPVDCHFPEIRDNKAPATNVFLQEELELTSDSQAGFFPGPPAHKGMQERCVKLLAKIKAKKGAMEAKFKANACKCLGCCEGECFFPVQERFKPNTQW